MTDISLIPDGGMPWLDASGPDAVLVLSTRVRLARNLTGVPFAGRNEADQRESIVGCVAAAARETSMLADATLYRLDSASLPTRRWLNERQLVSRELAGLDPGGRVRTGAALLLGRSASLLINEEDHLRLQALRSGFALDDAYRAAARADQELGLRVSFAFHPEFGYLTACPTNVGTGLRASVLIHLPALALTKEITKVLHGLAQVGLTHRGLFGEGSDVLGNLFQLSNQTTLGKSEDELLDHLARMVRQVMEYENRAREFLRREAPSALEDTVWRAWALLRHARTLSFEEGLSLLSGVRLGVALRILPDVPLLTLNRLLVVTQAAHVARWADVALDDPALPQHRAGMVRRMFEEVGPE
ncbi:MAG: ATP--guanido phosphotransferase [Gemmatimonadales bacterium]